MPIDLKNLPQPDFNQPIELYFEQLKPTAEERPLVARALAERMAREALDADSPRCVFDRGHAIFMLPWTEALVPGHTYSDAGLREARMSGSCEYCFDIVFANEEEEE